MRAETWRQLRSRWRNFLKAFEVDLGTTGPTPGCSIDVVLCTLTLWTFTLQCNSQQAGARAGSGRKKCRYGTLWPSLLFVLPSLSLPLSFLSLFFIARYVRPFPEGSRNLGKRCELPQRVQAKPGRQTVSGAVWVEIHAITDFFPATYRQKRSIWFPANISSHTIPLPALAGTHLILGKTLRHEFRNIPLGCRKSPPPGAKRSQFASPLPL